MHLERILIYLSFVILANANSLIKKELKEPKVQVETVRIIQQPKIKSTLDNSFMPVFLTSNVKANEFTQEMLKSLATNNYAKPSVKLSSINKQLNSLKLNKLNSSINKDKNNHHNLISSNKKLDKSIKSETISTRWSKASTSANSNFSPVLPINLSMKFDTTGFIPIIPKTAIRSSSNAKLIKQASKPISRQIVNSKTIPLSIKPLQATATTMVTTNTLSSSKRKTQIDLNKLNKETTILPAIRALKSIKSTTIPKSSTSSSFKPLLTTVKPTNLKSISSTSTKLTNAKIVDNRPVAAASSTELNSYLSSQLNSRDARKALLKMNTLRYLAKLSPQWSASSLSEQTYQQPSATKVGGLNAYPIGRLTIPG